MVNELLGLVVVGTGVSLTRSAFVTMRRRHAEFTAGGEGRLEELADRLNAGEVTRQELYDQLMAHYIDYHGRSPWRLWVAVRCLVGGLLAGVGVGMVFGYWPPLF